MDTNNLADQDPIQQLLDQLELYYSPKQWLQTMVMVLMVQSLGLDMESIVANNPTPPPFFDDDDDDHGSTGRLPLSPLNVCGWKGLQCSIDQQLRSLVWSKCTEYCFFGLAKCSQPTVPLLLLLFPTQVTWN
jgi:hypothetical protein